MKSWKHEISVFNFIFNFASFLFIFFWADWNSGKLRCHRFVTEVRVFVASESYTAAAARGHARAVAVGERERERERERSTRRRPSLKKKSERGNESARECERVCEWESERKRERKVATRPQQNLWKQSPLVFFWLFLRRWRFYGEKNIWHLVNNIFYSLNRY